MVSDHRTFFILCRSRGDQDPSGKSIPFPIGSLASIPFVTFWDIDAGPTKRVRHIVFPILIGGEHRNIPCRFKDHRLDTGYSFDAVLPQEHQDFILDDPFPAHIGTLILPRESGRGQAAMRSMSAGDL